MITSHSALHSVVIFYGIQTGILSSIARGSSQRAILENIPVTIWSEAEHSIDNHAVASNSKGN